MKPVTIVVLGKYPDIFENFRASAALHAAAIPKILVRDGDLIPPPDDWLVIQGPAKFSMAGNANLGWRAVPDDHDIFYAGDDVVLLEPNTVEQLQAIAYSDRATGILSPRILGGVNNRLQAAPPTDVDVAFSGRALAFPCVYIKRELVTAIGYLDERFVRYGYDDDDYCRRAVLAGYKLGVTARVSVRHDHSSATFKRSLGERFQSTELPHNKRIFDGKWAGR